MRIILPKVSVCYTSVEMIMIFIEGLENNSTEQEFLTFWIGLILYILYIITYTSI